MLEYINNISRNVNVETSGIINPFKLQVNQPQKVEREPYTGPVIELPKQ